MIVDIECPRCRGEGWLLQRAPRLGPGLYEVTCEHCNGHGAVAVEFTFRRRTELRIIRYV